jgi:hypothetical protein
MEIQELYKVAEIIDNCKIPEDNFIDLSLNEFLKTKGKVYFDINKKYFYKNLKNKDKWFRFKNENINTDFIQWANNFKNYVDDKFIKIDNDFKKLKLEHEESLKLINEFIDIASKKKLSKEEVIESTDTTKLKRGRPKKEKK